MPLDGASAFDDSTITLVLVADQVFVLGRDRRVVISGLSIIVDGITLTSAWNMVVEDTKTITTI